MCNCNIPKQVIVCSVRMVMLLPKVPWVGGSGNGRIEEVHFNFALQSLALEHIRNQVAADVEKVHLRFRCVR